jgi:hypothetical protein
VRQADGEGAAFAGGTRDTDGPAMAVDNSLGQIQPQPATSLRPAGVTFEKARKDLGEVLFRDSDSGIADRSNYPPIGLLDGNPNRSAGRGILHRIVQEIDHKPLQLRVISIDGRIITWLENNSQTLGFGCCPEEPFGDEWRL